MLRLPRVICIFCACLIAGGSASAELLVPLFNGKDLTHWYTFLKGRGRGEDPKQVFTVNDGVLRISGEEWGCITTEEEWENYRLVIEFKWGEKTWADRTNATRDSGVIIHSQGEDGGYSGTWMPGIECQMIEGGTGDFIVVTDGTDKFSISCMTAPEKQGSSFVFQPGGKVEKITSGRMNWWGRDPEWKDVLGFRGKQDVEKPIGEWNTYEITAQGTSIEVRLNGIVVNQARRCTPELGRIQIQSEGAELFVRKVDLYRLPETKQTVGASSEAEAGEAGPRLIYNSDADNMFLYEAPPMSAEQVNKYVDEISAQHVDALYISPDIGMVKNYPSAVAGMLGENASEAISAKFAEGTATEKASLERVVQNLRSLTQAGLDPLGLIVDRAKQQGLEVYASLRLNEVHNVHEEDSVLFSPFWKQHQEWRIGKAGDPLPQVYLDILGPGTSPIVASWLPGGLNFAVPEVRAYKLEEVRELCSGYDIDGIEFDFQRFPMYFPAGQEAENAAVMTAWLGEVRALTKQAGQERGRPIRLAARVLATPAQNQAIGLDPVGWVQQGLVDSLTVSHYLHNDFGLPIEEFRAAIPKPFPLYASIEVEKDPARYLELGKALVQAGADGLSVFNFFTRRESGEEPPFPVLAELSALEAGAEASPEKAPALDPTMAEPGLEYGHDDTLPLPRTILFSAGPEELLTDVQAWVDKGVNTFFLDKVARDWSSNIWATDGNPATIGYEDATFQQCVEVNKRCKAAGAETFLKIAFDNKIDWFNDQMWQNFFHNMRQFAAFARDTGCTGIALDVEYIGDQYAFDWPGYHYEAYSKTDLVARIRDRMGRALRFMYTDWPGMVLLTFPEEGFSLGTHIQAAWIEEAARINAPGGVHYCLEHTYRNPNIRYVFTHCWGIDELFGRILSEPAQKYWQEKCSIAAGVWPLGFNYQDVHSAGMTQEQFKQGYAASLMASARYNWIYSHHSREQLLGRNLGELAQDASYLQYLDVVPQREIVTTAPYVEMAKAVREHRTGEFKDQLGFVPMPVISGPMEVPRLEPMPAELTTPEAVEEAWNLALAYFRGEPADLQEHFNTVTNWSVVGPFPNTGHAAYNTVYPPESEINLDARYEVEGQQLRWQEYRAEPGHATVDFRKVFEKSDNIAAYAVCYVTSPDERDAQLRIGTNDLGKAWLGGKLVYENDRESTAVIDAHRVDIHLPAGTTPILVKVCNSLVNFGFVLRVCAADGSPMRDLSFSPVPPATPPLALLVVNKHEDTMAYIDPDTLHEFARVSTGHDPHEMVLTPDQKFAYLSNYAAPGNTVSVIDLVAHKHVQQISTGEVARIHSAALSPDGKLAYFTAGQSGQVVEISTESNAVVRTIPTHGKISHMVVVSPDGARLYTANIESQTVSVIDRASGELITQIPCGAGCEGLAFTPDGSRLWVANQNAGSITVISPTLLGAEATIPCPGMPLRIRFTADGKLALISNWVEKGELVVMDVATRQEVKRIPVGNQPIGVEITPDQKRAFVTCMTSNDVYAIDLESLEVTGHFYTGLGSDAMGWWQPPAGS